MNDLILALDKQKNNCAICENALPDLLVYNNRRRGYAIDHNHETGKFRGVLCLPCNSLLGMAKENVKILQSATDYLLSRGSYGDLVEKRTNKKGK